MASESSEHFKVLADVIQDKQVLADMTKLSDFCHTGKPEVFHSAQLSWVPKCIFYSYKGKDC